MYHCVQSPKAVSLSYTTTIQNELQVEGSEYIYMYQVVWYANIFYLKSNN